MSGSAASSQIHSGPGPAAAPAPASFPAPAVPAAETFLGTVGRRKFVLPLFETLMAEGEWGQPIARRIYAKTRAGYHAVTQGSVDKVVNPSS